VSVLGGPQEVEDQPAIALWAGRTDPCVPLRLDARQDVEGWTISGIPDDIERDEPRVLVLLTDPLSFPVDALLSELRDTWPALTVVGGMVSASVAPDRNRLLLDGEIHIDGAVGVLLPADLAVRAVVSQGCRPIGDPFVVTRSRGNVIGELGGQPARRRLEQLVERSTPAERGLLSLGVHLGIVIDERREEFLRGDFLVRAILGAERETGGLVVGDQVAVGTTVQFHVRDAVTADEDLRLALAGPPAAAALVFTCNGRGVRFFGERHHDALLVHDATGRGAVAGMFCAGEIGPVGLHNFVHGYTASVLLFGG
jgi:small ligand-binding sensory domain FIST